MSTRVVLCVLVLCVFAAAQLDSVSLVLCIGSYIVCLCWRAPVGLAVWQHANDETKKKCRPLMLSFFPAQEAPAARLRIEHSLNGGPFTARFGCVSCMIFFLKKRCKIFYLKNWVLSF